MYQFTSLDKRQARKPGRKSIGERLVRKFQSPSISLVKFRRDNLSAFNLKGASVKFTLNANVIFTILALNHTMLRV